MPGDVVFVQVGQCGNEIGHEFWKRICQEHGIAPDGTATEDRTLGDNCSTYFSSDDSDRLIPRAVLIDLEPRVLNCISNGEYAYFYNAERVFECRDGGGAGNNWGSGYGAVQDEKDDINEIGESIMNMIRSEVEICDKFDGFTLCHSIAGGTGSGLGSWILEQLPDFFEEKAGVHTFSVFPGKSDVVVQPYNAALTIARLMEFSDLTFVLENEAITKTAIQKMHNPNPSMRDVNEIIGRVMAGVTAPTRFGSPSFGSFNGISAQLSPVYPLHFVSCGIAPLIPANSRLPQRTTPIDLMQILEKPNSIMSTASQTEKNSPIDCLIAGLAIFQGEVNHDTVAQAIFKTNSHRPFGAPLLPFSDIDYCVTYPQAKSRSAVMAVNHSKFSQTLGSLRDDFTKMFKNGAYLTNFEKAACFKDDVRGKLSEAIESVKNLMTAYSEPWQYCSGTRGEPEE